MLQNWPDGEPALGWRRPAVSVLTRNQPVRHTCTKHSSPEGWTGTPSLQANWTLHLPLPFSTPTQAYLIIGCCCSVTKSCPALCDPMDCSMPVSLTLHYLPEFLTLVSIESVILSSHLILCCPLLLWPSIFLSITVFSDELTLNIRWPKY